MKAKSAKTRSNIVAERASPGRIFVLALVYLAATGCVTGPSTRGPHGSSSAATEASDLAALAEYNRQYLQSINDGDIATLSRLTPENHVMLAPDRQPITGKAANDARNAQSFERNRFEERWHPVETVLNGDWAFERGTYTVTRTPKGGGPARSSAGSYLRIFHRQPNGSWAMTYDMFNNDQPPG